MNYPYWRIAPEKASDPWIRRPLVPIALEGPARTLKFQALVDSGADHSLFHVDVAEALGIDLDTCEKQAVAGIEGVPAQSYVTEIKATVEHLAPVTIPVMFWERQPISLIGQVGFFDLHRLRFERDHDIFEITPVRKA